MKIKVCMHCAPLLRTPCTRLACTRWWQNKFRSSNVAPHATAQGVPTEAATPFGSFHEAVELIGMWEASTTAAHPHHSHPTTQPDMRHNTPPHTKAQYIATELTNNKRPLTPPTNQQQTRKTQSHGPQQTGKEKT